MIRDILRTLPFALLLGGCADADVEERTSCPVALSPDTTVVSDTQSFNASVGDVLVCGTGSAVLNASGGRVVVTSGGRAVLNAAGVELYVLDGGQGTANASGVQLFRESGARTNSNAGFSTEVECGTIEVDLSALPSGC